MIFWSKKEYFKSLRQRYISIPKNITMVNMLIGFSDATYGLSWKNNFIGVINFAIDRFVKLKSYDYRDQLNLFST